MENRKHRFCEGERYGEETIVLADGTSISFFHNQSCCENVWADLSALKDTGFEEDMSICFDTLKIERVKDYGVRVNGYGIPCYNDIDSCYSDDIEITISHTFDSGYYGMNHTVLL